ncbi:MAG: hypothetical protein CL566_10865 [Alphaproteobacteria bacterium]|nr:hypothetical protein [Alphaproteobacteria bacterium]|tara:strand:+ start:2498 stop:3640 length:1143 start_codon:yes stop_codon:yes gene_type:complete
MTKIRTWSALAGAALLLAACDFTDDILVPSLTGESPSGGERVVIPPSNAERNPQPTISGTPPQLGQTTFQPEGVTQGQATGTEVGRRVERLRSDLGRLQASVGNDDGQLQGLRQQTVANATSYQQLIAGIQSKLQVGTTPGNPNLVAAWNQAQATLDQISDNVGQMTSLSNKVADDSALASFVLESVRATYGLTGAVDEDHRQLAVLEDEVNRTVVLIDRLLNELTEDVSRQTNYVGRERSNLTVLSLAVKNGELFGTSLANRAFSSPTHSRGAAVGNLSNRRPLVVIRFDRENVPYKEPLFTAVSEALNRRPGAVFDIVSIVPQQGTPAQVALSANQARRNAEQVLQTLVQMGLPSDRLSLNSTSSSDVGSNEIRIFVR